MALIKFYYSLEEDAANWLRQFLRHQNNEITIPSELKSIFKDKLFSNLTSLEKEEQLKILRSWLQKRNELNEIKKRAQAIQSFWGERESLIVENLEKITERPICGKSFKASLTSLGICPYDKRFNWFMLGVQQDVGQQLTSIVHELLHLQFENYYADCLRGELTEKQYYHLKEAMTVILNARPLKDLLSGAIQNIKC